MSKKSAAGMTIIAVFAMAVFASACWMFLIEPMVAKMLLPLFGGSASVWNTCVCFFQTLLLAGYLYAHLLSSRLRVWQQIAVHLPLVLLAAFLLPPHVPSGAVAYETPVTSLLVLLITLVGAPFFIICTTAPLLSKWFSMLEEGGRDPYVLYVGSNAGGIVGLLAYPFYLEPAMKLAQQATLVTYFYLAYAVLVSICAFIVSRRARSQEGKSSSDDAEAHEHPAPPSSQDITKWLLLALTPQSLLLGITTYITSELSAIPFFWIAPLFIYLLSFVIAFSRLPQIARTIANIGTFLFVALSLVVTIDGAYLGGLSLLSAFIAIHLLTLFFVCCSCHLKLASLRPAPRYLTTYYLTISVGGVLGSSINTFLAPAVSKDFLEFPLMLMLAVILLANRAPAEYLWQRVRFSVKANYVAPLLVLLTMYMCWSSANDLVDRLGEPELLGWRSLPVVASIVVLQFVVPLAVCLLLSRKTFELRLGLAIVAVFALIDFSATPDFVVYQSRNFYGCLTIAANPEENVSQFYHGHILHGSESLDPDERGMPISYYYPTGPVGQLFSQLFGPAETLKTRAASVKSDAREASPDPLVERRDRLMKTKREKPCAIGVIGLGAGTIAAYAKREQPITFFEIDPEVVDIASNPVFFTYIFQAKARGVDLKIVKGDGRLEIQKSPYQYYKVIVADAFSGDAIPMHLLTKEAIAVYRSKLRQDGLILFNISNHYYDLKPVLQSLARDAELPAFSIDDGEQLLENGRTNATWVAITADYDMQKLLRRLGWKPLEVEQQVKVWTDDFSSPLAVLERPL